MDLSLRSFKSDQGYCGRYQGNERELWHSFHNSGANPAESLAGFNASKGSVAFVPFVDMLGLVLESFDECQSETR